VADQKPTAAGLESQVVKVLTWRGACNTREMGSDFHRTQEYGEEIMNWDQIKGDWKQMKGKVKEKWGELTDDDMDVIDGKRDQLVGALQKKYGRAKEEG
jgi:uncharacterized protein YjbJ (UPF0337 family)